MVQILSLFYCHCNFQIVFLCHTYQWISEWRTKAKIVYEIFTANFSPSPNLDKHSLLSNEIIKVFLGTLILAVPVWPNPRSKTNPLSARAISKLKHYSEQTKYYLHVTSFARNWLPARCFPPSHGMPCLNAALWLDVVDFTPVKVSLGKVHPFPLITGNPNELSSLTPSLGRHLQLASNFTLDSN